MYSLNFISNYLLVVFLVLHIHNVSLQATQLLRELHLSPTIVYHISCQTFKTLIQLSTVQIFEYINRVFAFAHMCGLFAVDYSMYANAECANDLAIWFFFQRIPTENCAEWVDGILLLFAW